MESPNSAVATAVESMKWQPASPTSASIMSFIALVGNLASGSRMNEEVGTSATFTTVWDRPFATLPMDS